MSNINKLRKFKRFAGEISVRNSEIVSSILMLSFFAVSSKEFFLLDESNAESISLVKFMRNVV